VLDHGLHDPGGVVPLTNLQHFTLDQGKELIGEGAILLLGVGLLAELAPDVL
jgi:hypothetical protein